jgi:hypothetical protein
MNNYVLRDNFDILGIYSSLTDAYHNWIELMNIFYRYNNNINILLNQIKIIQYNNNLIKNIYMIKNNELVDSENEIIKFNDIGIELIVNKLFNKDTGGSVAQNFIPQIDSEINLFIPISVLSAEQNNFQVVKSEINKPTNIEQIVPTINKEELEQKIKLLESLKQNEEKELNKLNDEFKKKEELYIKDKIKMDKIALKLKQEQLRWEAITKKFEVDKKLYFIFKSEIERNQRSEIPILFRQIYPVLEHMEQNNILNTINELQIYADMTKNFSNNIESNFDAIFNQNDTFINDDSSSYCGSDKNP